MRVTRSDARRAALGAALALAMLAALLPAHAPAAPAWQPPQLVSGTQTAPAYAPEIAISASGHALAVWLEGGLTGDIAARKGFYAWRAPHGDWGLKRSIPGSPLNLPAIGMSSFGTATLAYGLRDGDIAIVTGRPGRALEASETLNGPEPLGNFGTKVALDVDDEGGATVGWATAPNLLVATRRPGERFGAPQRLGDRFASSVDVAVNPAGAAVIAWGIGSERIMAAYRLPGETRFGPAAKVPRAAADGTAPLAAIEDDGTAIVATSSENRQRLNATGISFSERPPVGTFGPETRVSSSGSLHALLPEPRSGSAFIGHSGMAGGVVTAITRSASGALGAPVGLSGLDACFADAASNPVGQLVVAWTSPCPANPYGGPGSGVQVRRRAGPALAFDAPLQLTTNGSGARVAASPAGDAIVVFVLGPSGQIAVAASAFEDARAGAPSLVRPVIAGGRDPAVRLPSEGGALGLPVTCPQACSILAQGILATNGVGRATAAKASSRALRAKRRTTVDVRFSRARIAIARRALRSGRRASLSYTVTVRKRGSKTRLSFSRRVKLKSPE